MALCLVLLACILPFSVRSAEAQPPSFQELVHSSDAFFAGPCQESKRYLSNFSRTIDADRRGAIPRYVYDRDLPRADRDYLVFLYAAQGEPGLNSMTLELSGISREYILFYSYRAGMGANDRQAFLDYLRTSSRTGQPADGPPIIFLPYVSELDDALAAFDALLPRVDGASAASLRRAFDCVLQKYAEHPAQLQRIRHSATYKSLGRQ